MSGYICTQVGPDEYARTPVIIVEVPNPVQGQSPYTFKLGTPQYSSTPCPSGGSSNAGPGSGISYPSAPASFTLSQLQNAPVYDPPAGMYWGTVYNATTTDTYIVWAETADAAEWVQATPERNSAMSFDLYQFPLVNNQPKWVAVGDGVFCSRNYGLTWTKHQDWSTSPMNMLYVAQGTLVGYAQNGPDMDVHYSNDDGQTWLKAGTVLSVQLSPERGTSPFIGYNPGTLPANTWLRNARGGVNVDNPSEFGFPVYAFSGSDMTGTESRGFVQCSVVDGEVFVQGIVSTQPALGSYAQNSLIQAAPVWGLS